MGALIRLVVLGFVVLTVIYVCALLYSRAGAKARVRAEWEEEGHTGDRDLFMKEGLEAYENSLRRKLLIGVYIVPTLIVGTIIYITNYT